MGAGRPTKYKPEYAEQAHGLCLLGYTDLQLAKFFEVSEQTIYTWKQKHPEFLESLNDAKDQADGKVVKSLYREALEGNTTAQIFWLKNRQGRKWRDKQDHEHNVTVKQKADELTDDQLAAIATGCSPELDAAPQGEGKPH